MVSAAGPQRSFLALGSLVLFVAILYYAQRVLIPVALAVLLTFVLLPIVAWLQRQGLNRVSAVLIAVLLAFSFLGLAGWVVTVQLQQLTLRLPEHKHNIIDKISSVRVGPGEFGAVQEMWNEIIAKLKEALGQPSAEEAPVQVELAPSRFSWVPAVVGPAVETLANIVLVIMLVIFVLVRREDLRNRLIRLIGKGQLTATTRAMDEAGRRISGYLFMQLAVNANFGFLLAIGLFIVARIFSPDQPSYAFLWGFLAALLRFIPYVGTWIAALLPVAYSMAVAPGWLEPLIVLGLFLCLELFTFNVVEPLLFSHSTGVSPVALLVAVVFWTWLWGPIGLILATPLTTCLVVLGKYVPGMEFFDVLLSAEPALEPDVMYYQRLLARDQDEAAELVEDYIETGSLDGVYDQVLVPALVRAKHDRQRGELGEEEEEFMLQVTRDLLDDLLFRQQQAKSAASKAAPLQEREAAAAAARGLIFACPAQDEEDELALHMLRQLVEVSGHRLEAGSGRMLASELITRIKDHKPALVCIATLPPGGLAHARYLCKRLRSHFSDLKIIVGRWGQSESLDKMKEQLRSAGADLVGTTLLESRNQILALMPVAAAVQAQANGAETQAAKKS